MKRVYGTGEVVIKEDENGNKIKAIELTEDNKVIALMRIKDSCKLMTRQECERLNSKFQYWKHINNDNIKEAAKAYLDKPVYGLDDVVLMTMPLFYIGLK